MKKSSLKKTDGLDKKKKEKMLWISVVLISGMIFSGWIYNFIASSNIKISDREKKEELPQITDLKKQLQEIKSEFKKFNLKNATTSTTTSTNINNSNTEKTK